MKQLVVIVLMGLLQFSEAASNQAYYSFNKLLKDTAENSHARKRQLCKKLKAMQKDNSTIYQSIQFLTNVQLMS